jgi:hypothetical protein
MNLYIADLMVQERTEDRRRDFEANRLAALARAPRVPSIGWRERAGRTVGWFRVLRRGAAT